MLDQLARHALIDMTVAPRAICTSTTTTRSRIPASRSARRWRRRWATSAASGATGRATCRWTTRWCARARPVGRPYLVWNVPFPTAKIGSFDTELVREFFQALATHGGITLHVDLLHGINSHHIAEAAFKAVARALREAVEPDPRRADAIPSTKGAL
jgi:imidazoleglycerol-phosphate dehydratase